MQSSTKQPSLDDDSKKVILINYNLLNKSYEQK